MNRIHFNWQDVSKRKLRKNFIAVKVLRLLGFTVLPTIIAGENERSGEITYFTVSSLPVKWDTSKLTVEA